MTTTTKQAIEQVLKGKRNGMRVPAIIEAAVPLGPLKGKTPGQTFYSILYAEAKKPDGLVVQTGRGKFKLNPKRKRRRDGREALHLRPRDARRAQRPRRRLEGVSRDALVLRDVRSRRARGSTGVGRLTRA